MRAVLAVYRGRCLGEQAHNQDRIHAMSPTGTGRRACYRGGGSTRPWGQWCD